MKKKIRITICVVSVLLILAILLSVIRWRASIFTVEKWNTNIYGRERMLDDFLSKYDLKSMNREEVLSILGNQGVVSSDEDGIRYYIGKGYVGPVLLYIFFDAEGNVRGFDIVPD